MISRYQNINVWSLLDNDEMYYNIAWKPVALMDNAYIQNRLFRLQLDVVMKLKERFRR